MLTITDPLGHTQSTNVYDSTSGRMTKQTLADGTSTYQFGYTLNGTVVSQTNVTDPNAKVEVKQFDSNGFVTSDTYANGVSGQQQTFTFTRDPSTDLITSVTRPLPSPLTQRTTSYTYDSNGNISQITGTGGTNSTQQGYATAAANLTYDPTFNQLTSITDPLSHTWSIGYDNLGNATSITDPQSHQITLGYNLQGQVTSITDALNDTASFGYSYGDLTTITDPLGNTIHRYTDGAGRLIAMADALGNTTGLFYDNLDHLLQIADANGGLTRFAHDLAGNLSSVTDAKSNVTAYTCDSRNWVVTRKDALLKSESYGYDGNSNLKTHTDRNGNVNNYTYDALNRLTFAGFGKKGSNYQGGTITYNWDIGTRLTSAVDSIGGTITRTYDGLNHLLSEQSPQGAISYTYLSANGQTSGLRNSMTVAGQTAVNYTWDNANRLTAITQGSAGVGLNYDNTNRRTCLTLPNGVIASYIYDSDSRLTSLTYCTGGSCSSPPSNLGNLTYTYDANGRRTANAGGLAAVTLPANVTGGASTTYNADNAQSKFNGTNRSYDTNGNLLSDGTNTYTWDARNHLTAIAGSATASFVYDALGRRMSKTISGTTTQFLYDRLNPVQELNGSNGVTANLLTGLATDEYFTRTASSATSTYLSDALGSTIGLVTANTGPIATSYTYQPFGATTVGGSANGSSHEFTGRENDGTGLYFYRTRYYSPTFQRFVAQDPAGFALGNPNLYVYAGNNPANLIDPLGLWSVTISAYDGYGGSITFGENPNGSYFANAGDGAVAALDAVLAFFNLAIVVRSERWPLMYFAFASVLLAGIAMLPRRARSSELGSEAKGR